MFSYGRSLLLMIAMIPAAPGIAQTTGDTSLTAAVERYIDLVEAGDIRGCIDMVHPVLFKMVSKEKILEGLEKQLSEGPLPRTENGHIIRATGPLEGDAHQFALVEYAFTMVMPLPLDSSEETGSPLSAEEQAKSDELTVGLWQAMYGKKNVSWNSSSRQLSIDQEKAMYAILDPEIGAWRFLERKPGGEELVAQVIPEKIKKKLDR